MTGQWAFVGCRYCPIERVAQPAARSSRMTVRTSSTVSPRPTMSPDLVTAPRLAAASCIAVDRRDHGMAESEFLHRRRHPFGLRFIQRQGPAGSHRTVVAPTRADVA